MDTSSGHSSANMPDLFSTTTSHTTSVSIGDYSDSTADDIAASLDAHVEQMGLSNGRFLTGFADDGFMYESPFGTHNQFIQNLYPTNTWPKADASINPLSLSLPRNSELAYPDTGGLNMTDEASLDALFNDIGRAYCPSCSSPIMAYISL
jgi:hypothetical protein